MSGCTRYVRKSDASLKRDSASGCRLEVGSLCLDPARGPGIGTGRSSADGFDRQMTGTVLIYISGTVGHLFDLTGAPIIGTAGASISVTEIIDPIRRADTGPGCAAEFIAPGLSHVPPPPLGVAVGGTGVAVGGLPAANAGLVLTFAKKATIMMHNMSGTINAQLEC